ncbi:MAG: hypothetical protein K6T75_08105, partial [Acetobacteraceae bacterium]|nr:hypothetical protein [Acetobacteraceae bacterium]
MPDGDICGKALDVAKDRVVDWRWPVGGPNALRMAHIAEGGHILCWRDGLRRGVVLGLDPVQVSEECRRAFKAELEQRVDRAVAGVADPNERLRLAADAIAALWAEPAVFYLFAQSSAPAPALRQPGWMWYALSPAETHPLRNTATLADHALLVSALTVCVLDLIWTLTEGGARPGCNDVLGSFSPDFALGWPRLLHGARIAALLHDLGKPFGVSVTAGALPMFGHEHGAYSEAFVRQLLGKLLVGEPQQAVDAMAAWARHRAKGGPGEALVNAADVAAESDRAKSLPESWRGNWPDPALVAAALEGAAVPQGSSFTRANLAQLTQALSGLGLATPPVALIALKVDRPYRYIFEGRRLPEIRGGSCILRYLDTSPLETGPEEAAERPAPGGGQRMGPRATEIIARTLAPECVLFSGGGRILALVPYPRASEIAKALRDVYLHATCGAVANVAVLGLDWPELAYGLAPQLVWFDYPSSRAGVTSYNWPAGSRGQVFWASAGEGQDAPGDIGREPGRIIDRILRQKNFGEVYSHVEGLVGEAGGMAPLSQPFLEAAPVMRRCESCGYRPAEGAPVSVSRTKGEVPAPYPPEELHLCPVCRRRREAGRDRSLLLEELFPLELQREGPRLVPSDDLDHIGSHEEAGDEGEDRGGYIALIHADVNGMGESLRSAVTPGEFRRLSSEVERAIRESLREALRPVLQPAFDKAARLRAAGSDEAVPLPVEIVLRGGDECLFIVPGRAGLDVAVSLLTGFEERMTLGGRLAGLELCPSAPLTMSAAVVICHSRFPIELARRVAGDLLHNSAKRLAKVWSPARSTLDFVVLRRGVAVTQPVLGQRAATLTPQRRPALAAPAPVKAEPCRAGQLLGALTCRPLLLQEACQLVKA